MMFRNHMDPLYYDSKANAKIFVPQIDESQMTEEQRKIIASMPKEDMGEVLEEHEYAKKGYGTGEGNEFNHLVELDPLEAATKKHMLREDAAKVRADRRKREKDGILKMKDEGEYDSEKEEYDKAEEHDRDVKAEVVAGDDDDVLDNTYDSEFEEEFFGDKNPELNKEL